MVGQKGEHKRKNPTRKKPARKWEFGLVEKNNSTKNAEERRKGAVMGTKKDRRHTQKGSTQTM